MSYIGKSPSVGNFVKLDALTASATASYTMQVGSVNFVPESVNHMLVSLNGVIQAPTTSFTISGSTLTFASTLASSDSIDFIMVYGNVLDIGTPSDSTVTLAKLTATGTASSSTFLRGDNSWAASGGDLSFGGDTFGADKTIGSNDAYALSLETNNAVGLKIDNAGHVTKPLQPSFMVNQSGALTVANTHTLFSTSTTEHWDINSDYNNTGTFTAPVTGKYLLTMNILWENVSSTSAFEARFVTSNRTYSFTRNTIAYAGGGTTYIANWGSCVADMDASDTVYVQHYGPTAAVHVSTAWSWWQAYLLG